ncbi:hypothetical protein LCGC14_1407820 [marine sediment metagenome]|uniref:Uncharacterized protein n=1 Tax=marine sediment metagenome TaxID=412755 RepID=A0A0F9JV39_9ZZZZ
MDQIARFMTRIGLDPDVTTLDLGEWIGCKVTAILDEKEYEGKQSNVVSKFTSKGR